MWCIFYVSCKVFANLFRICPVTFPLQSKHIFECIQNIISPKQDFLYLLNYCHFCIICTIQKDFSKKNLFHYNLLRASQTTKPNIKFKLSRNSQRRSLRLNLFYKRPLGNFALALLNGILFLNCIIMLVQNLKNEFVLVKFSTAIIETLT